MRESQPVLKAVFLASFCSLFATASSYWIVGTQSVSYRGFDGATLREWPLKPSSWGFDAQTCSVWIEGERKVYRLQPDGTTLTSPVTGKIVSDRIAESVFVRDGDSIIRANEHGVAEETFDNSAFFDLTRIVAARFGYWSLHRESRTNRLQLMELSPSLVPVKKVVLSQGHDLWSTPKIFSGVQGHAWIGFTTSTASTTYSPAFAHVMSGGTGITQKTFSERGIFFDGCIMPDSDWLLARDIPSNSGFTLPVHSYLEKIDPLGRVARVYSAETNMFIDSIACHDGWVSMIQRSIFGSDGSYLLRWKNGSGGTGELLAHLEEKASQIYHCEGR